MSEATDKKRSLVRPFPIAAALAWTVLILVLCLTPDRMVPSTKIYPTDKVVHVLLFAVLGLLWMAAGAPAGRRPWTCLAVWAGGTVFGVGIEGLQGWMGNGRTASALDALADAIGLVVGIWGYHAGVGLARRKQAVRRAP